MKIQVSSSLQGRDLAVIKSLININNIYGELCLEYVNDMNTCQLLIISECHGKDTEYYALNKQNEQKYTIEPGLNPQSIRSLFHQLSETIEVTTNQNNKLNACSLAELVLQHLESTSEQFIKIQTPEVSVVLDKVSNRLFSSTEITESLMAKIKNVSSENIKFISRDEQMTSNYSHNEPLELFKWQLGFFEEDNLIHQHCLDSDIHFKQVSWPNYGECEFENEFINLSSMLCHKSESYSELKRHSNCDEKIINKFLNATLMTGNVIVLKDVKAKQKNAKKTRNPFLVSLKRLFMTH